MILLLMRHGKSSWANPGQDDHERGLKPRGVRAAAAMGRLMVEEGISPAQIVSSTAVRARDTAEGVAAVVGDLEVETVSQLYLAPPRTIRDVIESHGRQTPLLLVGHQPGMGALVEELSGPGDPVDFPTAALAAFELNLEEWGVLHPFVSSRRIGFWTPRELDDA